MAKPKKLKLVVHNFGPVGRGEFELLPLTIFIGPNNSGKSYMALLVYALSKALALPDFMYYPQFLYPRYLEPRPAPQYAGLSEWLRTRTRKKVTRVSDLPKQHQENLQRGLVEYLEKRKEQIETALQEYFGYEEMNALLRPGSNGHPLSVDLTNDTRAKPLISIRLSKANQKCAIEIDAPDLLSYTIPIQALRRYIFDVPEALGDVVGDMIIENAWVSFLNDNGFNTAQGVHYLPSARSGVLQGWQGFASLAVELVRSSAGLRRIEVPQFRGVVGDFLQVLVDSLSTRTRRRRESSMKSVFELLESEVFHGQVSFDDSRSQQGLMIYKSGKMQVPLHRASSMIAELAPLDIWLKYLVRPGDLLIIDEPEAHLHPENQRLVARLLVRLIREGVRVLSPTHSSLILHQLSNLILAAQLSPEERANKRFDYSEADLLDQKEIAVYLFSVKDGGTHIVSVPIDTMIGISEDEFLRVADAIGEESYELATAVLEGDSKDGKEDEKQGRKRSSKRNPSEP